MYETGQDGQEEMASAVVLELSLMGFSSEKLERGSVAAAQGPPALTVELHDSESATLRQVEPPRTKAVTRSSGEPVDHFALRAAELARAWLLEPPPLEEPETPGNATPRRRFSVTLSQILLVNGYGSPAGGLASDLAMWWGRFGLGPYASISLTRQLWNENPKKFSLRLSSAGLLFKYSLAATSSEIFEAQVLGRLGGTALFLREEGGKDEDRFRGSGFGFEAGGGIDLGFRVGRHVRLGGRALGEAITLLSWPTDDDELLGGKEAELLVKASKRGAPQYQVNLSFGMTGVW